MISESYYNNLVTGHTCSPLAGLAVYGGHVVGMLPEPLLHVATEGQHLAELGRGVVVEWVDRHAAVELLDVVTPLGAEVVHLVVVAVSLLQEPLDVLKRVPVHGFHAL